MKATTTNEKPLQGEIKNAPENENTQNDPVEKNEIEARDFSSSCAKINLSMRQRGIIGSCFGEDFLL
jgi:hypothetical protein